MNLTCRVLDPMLSCISPPFRFPFMVKMSISLEHLHFCDACALFLERITIWAVSSMFGGTI